MKDPRARPTLFVPLVGIPALLIFLGGGLALARVHARAAENVVPGVTPPADLVFESRVPNGAYVETEGTLEQHHHGVWFADHHEIAVERPPFTEGHQHLVGRICSVSIPPIGCDIPHDRPIDGSRWLLVGETPEGSRRKMMQALAIAAFACLAYVAIVAFSRRRRKGPARVVEERTWTLPSSAEDVALALRMLHGADRFQVVDEGPGRLAFIQGYSENAARGWGIRKAAVFPRRATITWTSSPRDPAQVTARIDEDLLWWPAQLTPTMDRLARESIASTLAEIERVLGVR